MDVEPAPAEKKAESEEKKPASEDEKKTDGEKKADEESKKPEKEPEPDFEMLKNPARVVPAQLKVISLQANSRYKPVKPVCLDVMMTFVRL